ncbi:MAG: hypothetical protein JXR70_08535 [Spirochaetales bacterium]|nr:hypothetical protein [Spirochaetales bacterium]
MNVLKPASIKLETVTAIAVKPDIVASGCQCAGCNCGAFGLGELVLNPIIRK